MLAVVGVDATGTVLLDKVASRVPKLDRLCPQHLVAQGPAEPTGAVLVDQWGRMHGLASPTLVGREFGEVAFAVLDGSVSRVHAEFRRTGDGWTVVDWGSTNGTFVGGTKISEPTRLSNGDMIAVGEVGFAFYEDGADRFKDQPAPVLASTFRSPKEAEGPCLLILGQVAGGGGVVEFNGEYVQLGPSRYALVRLLAARQAAEAARDEAVRGYVRSVEMLDEIPWDTPYPDDNNVKQLVRRVRRVLEAAGVSKPIEARYGFGYRLSLPARIQEA